MSKKAAAVVRGTDGLFTVVLPKAVRPGIRAVGPYLTGTDYRVTFSEATRLVSVKGFQLTTDAEAQRFRAAVDQFNAAAQPNTAHPASEADGQGGGTSSAHDQE